MSKYMKSPKTVKGTLSGLASGILWGLDTLLIGIILSLSPFSEFTFTAPLISTFMHDAFSSIWLFIYMIATNQATEVFKHIKTKSGLFVILGALCGGPIGMTGYVLAIYYIGSSYTASISAMYPAVGAFFAYIFLKDKLKKRGILGLCLAISATIFLGFTTVIESHQQLAIGFIFAAICAIGWGLESVICSHGMKKIPPPVALQIRQLISALCYAVIIIPVFKAYHLVYFVAINPVIIFLALTALAGTASYLFYYNSINSIGPTRAMALNISYSAWAVLFGWLLGNSITLKLVLVCVAIIIGSILTADKPKEILDLIIKKNYKFKRKKI